MGRALLAARARARRCSAVAVFGGCFGGLLGGSLPLGLATDLRRICRQRMPMQSADLPLLWSLQGEWQNWCLDKQQHACQLGPRHC